MTLSSGCSSSTLYDDDSLDMRSPYLTVADLFADDRFPTDELLDEAGSFVSDSATAEDDHVGYGRLEAADFVFLGTMPTLTRRQGSARRTSAPMSVADPFEVVGPSPEELARIRARFTLANTAETAELPTPSVWPSPSRTKASPSSRPSTAMFRPTTPEVKQEANGVADELRGGPSVSFRYPSASPADLPVIPPQQQTGGSTGKGKARGTESKGKGKETIRAAKRRFDDVEVEDANVEAAGSDHASQRANSSRREKRARVDGTGVPELPKVHDNRLVPVLCVAEGRHRCHIGECDADILPSDAAWDEHLKEVHFAIGLPKNALAEDKQWDPRRSIVCPWADGVSSRCPRTMALDSLGRHLATIHVRGMTWKCPVEGCKVKPSTRKDACKRHIKQVHSALFEVFPST
ncbi:hypothetical protein B0H21DRAFT_881715 [Amylocystis lapponica]|nr:hypothetical protein B0H21DRAFT_881715 [Amylocystis lapponica]